MEATMRHQNGALHVLLVLFFTIMSPCDSQTCRYEYIEQPREVLTCDPFFNNRLFTRCIVEFPIGDDAINIEWVFRPISTPTVNSVLGNSARFTITETSSINTANSQLMINFLSNADIGSYFCRGVFVNGSAIGPSQELQLEARNPTLPACSLSIAQTVQEERCALTFGGQAGDGGNGGNGGGGSGGALDSDIVLAAVASGVVLFIVLAVIIVTCLLLGNAQLLRRC